MAALLCTVRDCRLPLAREERRLRCARGHSFDVARSGYVNLLQPQERRAKEPGDSRAAAAARRRVHDRGVAAPLLRTIEELLAPSHGGAVLDAGCGDGFFLGELQRAHRFEAHGIDISTSAVELAAKRYPDCSWIVGNADRFLPWSDASFSKIMSITARMNAAEFRRLLRDDGRLLVAVSAPDDLVELRGASPGRAVARPPSPAGRGSAEPGRGRDRVQRTVETFAPWFQLLEQRRATTVIDADEELVRDLRRSIYRPRGATGVKQVTLSLDLLLFR